MSAGSKKLNTPALLEAPVTPGKRKAENKKDTPPAKKAKSEGEGKKRTSTSTVVINKQDP